MALTLSQKKDIVTSLKEKADQHSTIGLLDLTALPAKQLQQMKRTLRGTAEIIVSRRTLLRYALEQSDKEALEELFEKSQAVQPALIFSNESAFSLNNTLKKNKSSAPAKPNAIAPKDVVIEEGPTEFAPGPMISEFQKLGLETKVEKGAITIEKTATVVNEGQVIDAETAEVLNKLGMEPLEIGLDMKAAYDEGVIFTKDVLDVDEEEYYAKVQEAFQAAFNLSVNAGYPNSRNIETMIAHAVQKTRNMAINAKLPIAEYMDDIIAKAVQEARALDKELGEWQEQTEQSTEGTDNTENNE